MSLFETKDLGDFKEPEKKASSSVDDNSLEDFITIKSRDDIARLIEKITERKLIHYCTGGVFSAHELLFSLLEKSGPAKVYLTTWTMTEYPARLLCEALMNGRITELYCLLDVRMEKNPNVYQLIRNNSTQIRLSHCHAKVIVIDSENFQASVISSQNMTENPRIEAGIISTNPDAMKFHRDWILKEVENGTAFE